MNGAWFLYLDESGDLGFDSSKPGRSNYFTICILAIRTPTRHKAILNAAKKTFRRKVNHKTKGKGVVQELKGSKTSIGVKTFFFNQIAGVHFGVYALTLEKSKLYEKLQKEKDRTYNYLSRLLLDELPFEAADTTVDLFIDKSKSQKEISNFNSYISRQLKQRLPAQVLLRISHGDSCSLLGLQAADLFSHGIFRKYERNDLEWFDVFKGKVRYETLFPRK